MPVFRVEKNSNYTTMCNYHLRDQGLSLKGKGLLSMLLSLPDTWNYSVRGLSSITPDGVDGVLTALKELERLGYLERNQQRESNGRMGRAEYVIYEMPRKKQQEFGIAYAKGILDTLGIKYDTSTDKPAEPTKPQDPEVQAAIEKIQTKAGLEEKTIEYLLAYKYGEQLVKKLAEAMQQ